MNADPNPATRNEWRETVRDIYDDLHFCADGAIGGNPLACRLIAFIEKRHPDCFDEPRVSTKDVTNAD